MTGNSFNLVDSIRGYVSDTFTNRLSLLLGESHEKTQSALHAAVPGVLSALDTAAATPDGARRLATAIEDTDDTIVDNYSGIFGKDFSSDTHIGTLRSLMGGGFSDFTSNLGRLSGLSLRSVTTLLGVVAPVIFGVIKRSLRARAMRSADVGSFLASQRSNIASALPSGMAPRFTEETYTGPRDATRARRTTHTDTETESNAGKWILPLAGVLAALGLIWYLASRPATDTMREARTTTEPSPVRSTDLTTKYQSVINEARTQGLELSTVRQENGKLMLRGTAPSQEAADKVWAEIRRVDPGRQDIMADFSVGSAAHDSTATDNKVAQIPDDNTPVTRDKPEATGRPDVTDKPDVTTDKSTTTVTPMPLEKPAADDSKPRSYTVKAGDTLGTISKEFYGTTKDYGKIFEANRSRINDPNVLHVGEELTIP